MKTQRELFTHPEQVEEAISYYTGRISESSDDGEAFMRRGFLHYVTGKYPDALDDINRVIHLDPDNPVLYCLRGLIFGKLEDSGEAWENFERASELNPSFAPSFIGKAALEFFQEDTFLAGAELENAMEQDPENHRAFLYRGLLRLHDGEFMDCIKDLKEAENRNELWQCFTKRVIGKAFLKDGIKAVEEERFEKAVISFLQFIDSEPENPEGHFHLGGAYMNLEEWEDARECFEKAAELGKRTKIGKDAREMLEVLDSMDDDEDEDEESDEEEEADDEDEVDDEESEE